jgi:hypothetical protein
MPYLDERLFVCASCSKKASSKLFMPIDWTNWVPHFFSYETEGDLDENGKRRYYCPQCGPSCEHCGRPIVKSDNALRWESTKTFLHENGNRPIFGYATKPYHEECYRKHCEQKALTERMAKATRLAAERRDEKRAPESRRQAPMAPIREKDVTDALLGGVVFLFQLGPVSAAVGLILSIIYDWSWFWWITVIGSFGGFLLGFYSIFNMRNYRSPDN